MSKSCPELTPIRQRVRPLYAHPGLTRVARRAGERSPLTLIRVRHRRLGATRHLSARLGTSDVRVPLGEEWSRVSEPVPRLSDLGRTVKQRRSLSPDSTKVPSETHLTRGSERTLTTAARAVDGIGPAPVRFRFLSLDPLCGRPSGLVIPMGPRARHASLAWL